MAVIDPSDRDFQAKVSFIDYITKHPQERLFQSIRNFAGVGFIVATDKLPTEGTDTFYWEGKVIEDGRKEV